MTRRERLLLRPSQEDLDALTEIFGHVEGGYEVGYADLPAIEGLNFSLANSFAEQEDDVDISLVSQLLSGTERVPDSFKHRKKKTKSKAVNLGADDVLASARFADNQAVHEAMSALHPDLLLLIDEHFIPGAGESMFDPSCDANVNRDIFLRQVRDAKKREKNPKSSILVNGDDFIYMSSKGEVLVSGSALDVFKYAVEVDIGNAFYVYQQMAGHSPKIKRDLEGVGGYTHLLKMFRHERSKAKSLDKFSKVTQLKRSDQDAPYYWFDDLIMDSLILHPNLPLQVKARYQKQTIATLEEMQQMPEGAAYVVDVTRGGVEGASSNDIKLLQKILEKGGTAYMHLFLGKELIGLPMVMVNKSRPHNHTAVFFYDPDLPIFTEKNLEELLADVRVANEERNKRFHGAFATRRIGTMPPHNLILDMVTYLERLKAVENDVTVIRAALRHYVPRDKKLTVPSLQDNIYTEISELFREKTLPSYIKMVPPNGLLTMVTKPLRLLAVNNISKDIMFNMIMTVSEGKRGYFFGEWWYIRRPSEAPKGLGVARAEETAVYPVLTRRK